MRKIKYEVVKHFTWQDEQNNFQIDDSDSIGFMKLSDDITSKEVFEIMKNRGYFDDDDVKISDITIEINCDTIYIDTIEGKQLYSLCPVIDEYGRRL